MCFTSTILFNPQQPYDIGPVTLMLKPSNRLRNNQGGTSLVAQWLRIRLPVQGTRDQSLVREDPTCSGATKPVHHNYWACALEPVSHNYWARASQLQKPTCLEPLLRNKRSHHNEKPTYHKEEWPPLATTRESQCTATDPTQPKINKCIYF